MNSCLDLCTLWCTSSRFFVRDLIKGELLTRRTNQRFAIPRREEIGFSAYTERLEASRLRKPVTRLPGAIWLENVDVRVMHDSADCRTYDARECVTHGARVMVTDPNTEGGFGREAIHPKVL